ncbi:hypothetical protein BHE74_00056388 [Ensete ventricosum]|nr:hypothetical protein BHE74_00056388 [Ensete ventricosum]
MGNSTLIVSKRGTAMVGSGEGYDREQRGLRQVTMVQLHGREIVYPCIPDPDGEYEGGQAFSSLTVSTRWISAAKPLQSDVTTLAQREGGE